MLGERTLGNTIADMKSWLGRSTWQPRSLLQLVIAIFVAVLVPVSAMVTQFSRTMHSFEQQAALRLEHSLTLTRRAQSLVKQGLTLERIARQASVLNEREMWQLYLHHRDTYLEQLDAQAMWLEDDLVGQLLRYVSLIDAVMSAANTQQAIDAVPFAQFSGANRKIQGQTQARIESYNKEIAEQLTHQQQRVWIQLGGMVILMVMLLSLLLRSLLRPLRRLEQHILSIGQGSSVSTELLKSGPVEIQRLEERVYWLQNRLSELEDQKQSFLRHMSHELKTPLTSIREGSELLVDEVAGPVSSQQREVVELIQQGGIELQSLIEQLLAYSQLAQRPAQIKECSVKALINRSIKPFTGAMGRKGISVEVDCRVDNWPLDQELMQRALSNLVSNVIAYGEHNRPFTVRCAELNDQLIIDVENFGSRIEPSERLSIFEPFQQGQATRQGPVKGSGVGLSIVTECVKQHGGQVSVVDSRRADVCFRMMIPFVQAEQRVKEKKGANNIADISDHLAKRLPAVSASSR